MLRELSVVVVAAVLAACGGRATTEADEPSSGGSTAAGGSSAGGSAAGGSAAGGSAAGGSGSGGATASGGAAGSAGQECIPQGDGWSNDLDPTCEDLSVLAVQEPVLVDDGGDGALSPGEGFGLAVVLAEVAGLGFGWYPGVKFESDTPGVSIKENDWFYGIFACTSYDVGAEGKVDASVKPGTVVTLTARAAMLNTECPSAPALELKLTVK